jgi:hypothetical protein
MTSTNKGNSGAREALLQRLHVEHEAAASEARNAEERYLSGGADQISHRQHGGGFQSVAFCRRRETRRAQEVAYARLCRAERVLFPQPIAERTDWPEIEGAYFHAPTTRAIAEAA